jgi:hypothetical protein
MLLESSGRTKLILWFLRVMLTVSTTTSGASAVYVCEQLDSFIFIEVGGLKPMSAKPVAAKSRVPRAKQGRRVVGAARAPRR